MTTWTVIPVSVPHRRVNHAQVTQAQCRNVLCASNPGVCRLGCVCCVYSNGNSRCRPPQDCTARGTVATTTTTTTTAPPCVGCSPSQDACLVNGSCAQICNPGCPVESGCVCSTATVEDPGHCIPFDTSCAASPQACASTAECLQGQHCQVTVCGPNGSFVNRCVPLCAVT